MGGWIHSPPHLRTHSCAVCLRFQKFVDLNTFEFKSHQMPICCKRQIEYWTNAKLLGPQAAWARASNIRPPVATSNFMAICGFHCNLSSDKKWILSVNSLRLLVDWRFTLSTRCGFLSTGATPTLSGHPAMATTATNTYTLGVSRTFTETS